MSSDVNLEIFYPGKSFTADVARVGLLERVYPHVNLHFVTGVECLAFAGTLVPFALVAAAVFCVRVDVGRVYVCYEFALK